VQPLPGSLWSPDPASPWLAVQVCGERRRTSGTQLTVGRSYRVPGTQIAVFADRAPGHEPDEVIDAYMKFGKVKKTATATAEI
jgi:hypothetical protein